MNYYLLTYYDTWLYIIFLCSYYNIEYSTYIIHYICVNAHYNCNAILAGICTYDSMYVIQFTIGSIS